MQKMFDAQSETGKLIDAVEWHRVDQSLYQDTVDRSAMLGENCFSRVKRTRNCNLNTFVKICNALNLDIILVRKGEKTNGVQACSID